MPDEPLLLDGVAVPRFLYGTAWKEDATRGLVAQALAAGFRGIDTANQRKHYFEAAVGAGIADARAAGTATRDALFLQTKFTFRRSQDHRLPYDAAAPVGEQVAQSFAASCAHLGCAAIDSYVLHGPSARSGLAAADIEAWRAMEALHGAGRVRLLGISNVSLDQLRTLCRVARVAPRFVQNRCYAARGWDAEMRGFCRAGGIVYQGFSLLTANPQVLAHPETRRIAERHAVTPAQAVFRFALEVGMLPLTGTRDEAHMRADLAIGDFRLAPEEVARIEGLGAGK